MSWPVKLTQDTGGPKRHVLGFEVPDRVNHLSDAKLSAPISTIEVIDLVMEITKRLEHANRRIRLLELKQRW